jgi:dipeptidyl aminopeptidase/acylaminoacyl peptidase
MKLLALVCPLSLLSSIVNAQEVRPLPVTDVLRSHSFGETMPIEFSPDGKWLVYTVKDNQRAKSLASTTWSETGVVSVAQGLDVWISNTEKPQALNLTGGVADNWHPVWSPDGHFVAFFSDRDGNGQAKLWLWDSAKNAIRKVCDSLVRGSTIEWTPDSRKILFTTLPGGFSVRNYPRSVPSAELNQTSGRGEMTGSTVTLFRSRGSGPADQEGAVSDPWDLNKNLVDLASVEVATGNTNILVHARRISMFRVSPDGSSVAFTIPLRFEKPGSQQILYDLAVVSIMSSQPQVIASSIHQGHDGAEFSWSPDSSLISYRETGPGEMLVHDCYVISVKEGSPHNVTNQASLQHQSQYSSGIPLWDRRSRNIYFVDNGTLWRAPINQDKAVEVSTITDRKIMWWLVPQSSNTLWTVDSGKATIVVARDLAMQREGFYQIDLSDGESTRLLEKDECYTCTSLPVPVAVTKDGARVAYFAENPQHDSDIWISDQRFGNPRPLTQLNPQFETHELGSVKLIDWLSDDGDRLQGALLLPTGFQDGKRYPLIIWVYGGSLLSKNVHRFGLAGRGQFNMQLLATRGYAVLLPDSPQHEGTPMLDLAKTVLPGVNKVIDMGIADPDHLGVMGHSNGGYSALCLIVQTKRFKAAVELSGMGNLVGFYGEMDPAGGAFGTSTLEHNLDALGGAPWQFRDRYVENSPIFHLDRIETPLLIVHGSADTTVAPFLGDELFVGLRRLGKEAEYARYAGEGHVMEAYENRADFCERMITWFDKYLKPGGVGIHAEDNLH